MCARVGALGGGGTLAPAEGLHGSCQGNPEWAPCQSGLCVREPRLSWFRQWGFPSRTIAPSRLRKGQRLGESGPDGGRGPIPCVPPPLGPRWVVPREEVAEGWQLQRRGQVGRAPGDPGPLSRLPRRRSKWTRCRSSALTAAPLLCAWTRTSGRSCRVWLGRKVGAPSPTSAPLPRP